LPTINVSQEDKDRFTSLKPSEKSQKEFFAEVLRTYEHADETVEIDSQAIVKQVKHEVGPAIENYAYRGVKEGLERNGD